MRIDMYRVFKIIGCGDNDPVYNEAVRLFKKTEEIFYGLINPASEHKFCRDILEGYEYTVLTVCTLGDEIEHAITRLFESGQYMEGSLMDAMASDYLMQMDDEVCRNVKNECMRCGLGIAKVLEPGVNISADYQKIIADKFKHLNITVTDGLMLKPLKSLSKMILASHKLTGTDVCHSCADCGLAECRWRKEILKDREYFAVTEYEKVTSSARASGFGIGIDIGTTTIVFKLIDLSGGKDTNAISILNGQMKYGGEIVSRETFSNAGGLSELGRLVWEDLNAGIEKIIAADTEVKRIVIAANTAMVYFLMGIDTKELAVYPFKFVTGKAINIRIRNVPATILPSASAFIGGDILSGVIFTRLHEKNNTMLIDIGTNTEIVLNSGGNIICTSAAAGPAFEGGNIECGTGSVKGAIKSADYSGGKFLCKTIGGEPPIGICGSGLIDIICCLLKNNIIDKTGLLLCDDTKIEICDGVYITQNDIRQFQLAKSAIRAGIELLIDKAGSIDGAETFEIFLGGGFGSGINVQNAVYTGLFPEAFADRVVLCGNTSLGGCEAVMRNEMTEEDINRLAVSMKNVDISKDERFNDLFIRYIDF